MVAAQDMFHRLQQEGFIQEQTIEQLFSEKLGKFLADRFVWGKCPKCGYEVIMETALPKAPACMLGPVYTTVQLHYYPSLEV